jgi:hypothetical protein
MRHASHDLDMLRRTAWHDRMVPIYIVKSKITVGSSLECTINESLTDVRVPFDAYISQKN